MSLNDDPIFPFSDVDDLSTLFNEEQIPFHSFNVREALLFPTFTNHSHNPLDEIDLELNNDNYQPKSECKYYDAAQFQSIHNCNDVSLLFCNINSVSKNMENFLITNLKDSSFVPKVIGFCETKLNSSIEHLYEIDGYESIHNSRNTHSGGVSLYLSSNLEYSVIEQYRLQEDDIESLIVEIKMQDEVYKVCVMYRRPGSNFENFMLHYREILSYIGTSKFIICGVFNLKLLQYESSSLVETYVNGALEHGLISLINKPTRVTSHSATVIDHIFSNISPERINTGILMSDSSDHFAIFMYLPTQTNSYNLSPPKLLSFRKWSNCESESFREFLSEKISEFNYSNPTDIDCSLDNLLACINSAIETFCPLITHHIKYNGRSVKNWISSDLAQMIKDKNRLYAKYCKKPITYGNAYRIIRNRVNNLVKTKKKLYYQNLFDSYQNDC